jgi:hypothetical protein
LINLLILNSAILLPIYSEGLLLLTITAGIISGEKFVMAALSEALAYGTTGKGDNA